MNDATAFVDYIGSLTARIEPPATDGDRSPATRVLSTRDIHLPSSPEAAENTRRARM